MKGKCHKCNGTFEICKYHPTQKYCKACNIERKRETTKRWYIKKGKEYMRKYMSNYRLLSSIILMYNLLMPQPLDGSWLDYKKDTWFEEYSGIIGLSGSFTKPPNYQLSLKLTDNSYFTLNRFLIKKKGWIQKVEDEQESSDTFFSEPKEAGSFSIEFGSTGSTAETSLLESESVYGWKLQLGQSSEILWGKGMYGDRIASASFNTEKFNFFITKSFGMSSEGQDSFMLTGYETENPNMTLSTAKPLTKYEGGNLKIPFEWRQTRGEFEIAGRKKYSEELQEYKNGVAFALNISGPRIIMSVRNLGEGYESETRTTDISLKGVIYKTPEMGINTGYRLTDFSGDLDSRHAITAGINRKIKEVNINIDGEMFKQGNNISQTAAGGVTGTILNTNITLRRTEGITGLNTTESNSLTISRREASLSLSQSSSEYKSNKSNNLQASLNLNIIKDLRIAMGGGESVTLNSSTKTTMRRFNSSIGYKKTSLNMNLSPTSETYNLTREIDSSRFVGYTIALGTTYQRFVGGEGVTGNISFSW